jgi:cyclic pyranopterin phosphate synthase
MGELSHIDKQGDVRMVDVARKEDSARSAVAGGRVTMSSELLGLLRQGAVAKGNVLAVAKTAGIMAAKRTSDLIPLCHPLQLDHLDLDFTIADDAVEIIARVKLVGRTGAEMEALTAVAVAGLTLYDMCKAVDKRMVIGDIRLLEKTGGKSGTFRRE